MTMVSAATENERQDISCDPAKAAGSLEFIYANFSAPVRWLSNTSKILAVLVVFALLVSINFEVFSRYFLQRPTVWVTEFSSYFLVAITFLGGAYCQLKGSHIRVTLLRDALPDTSQRILDITALWFSVFVTLILIWRSADFLGENFVSETRSWSLIRTPFWIPQSTILVGYVLMLLALLTNIAWLGRVQGKTTKRGLLSSLGVIIFASILIFEGWHLFSLTLSAMSGLLLSAAVVMIAAVLLSGIRNACYVVALAAPLLGTYIAFGDSSLAIKAAVIVGALMYLLALGVPVLFTLGMLALLAISSWLPPVSILAIGERTWEAVNSFELAAIPMFIMMGSLLVRSRASTEMYNATRTLFGRFRGGLAHASIGASGIFAAVSGSSLATAAAMGRVAGSEMTDNGYKPELAYGVLAAGGTLGILIPPSIAMIVYGPLAGVPVTDLFLAGIIPGISLMVAFSVVVFLWVTIDPAAAPKGRSYTWREKVQGLKGVGPFVALISLVLGSIYAGIATPTEAGGVGVIGALLVAAFKKSLSWQDAFDSLEEAAVVTCFLLLIAVGASHMGFVIDFLNMPQSLVGYMNGLEMSNLAIFIALVLLYVVLGMFVEPISMLLITLPVVLPIVSAAGWDLMWFGVVLVMLVEIGLITPPVGMILFVLSGVSDKVIGLGTIALGAVPFVLAFLSMIALFYAFPEIITWLPKGGAP